MVERYALEPDPAGELLLRSVPEPWPFPPQLRVVPELVAAVDLADGPALELVELGRARLVELTADLEPLWRRRSRRGASVRPLIPTRAPARRGARLQVLAAREDIWDDRAERDARGLVALLFVAGGTAAPRRTGGSAALLAGAPRSCLRFSQEPHRRTVWCCSSTPISSSW